MQGSHHLGGGPSPLRLPLLTQDQGGNESCSHPAGTQQEGVWDAKVAIRDPAKDDGCDGCQEAHHGGLYLGRGVVMWGVWSRAP